MPEVIGHVGCRGVGGDEAGEAGGESHSLRESGFGLYWVLEGQAEGEAGRIHDRVLVTRDEGMRGSRVVPLGFGCRRKGGVGLWGCCVGSRIRKDTGGIRVTTIGDGVGRGVWDKLW